MKNSKRGLFSPIFLGYLALFMIIALFGAVRYLYLSGVGEEENVLARVIWEIAPAAAFLLISGIVTAIFLTSRVTRPLKELRKEVRGFSGDIADGEKIHSVEACGEIALLSEELVKQSDEIVELLKFTERQTAQETEARTKLSFARDLVKMAVPDKFSLQGDGLSICAGVQRSSAVGADFVDAFLLDPRRVFFAIGDIWGKGLPAAFFVSKLKSELRTAVLSGKSLGEIVLDVNRSLLADNPHSLAATLFVGIFYAETGELRFVNMGHVPPIITGVKTGYLHIRAGSPLGLYENISVGEESFRLFGGQALVLCTDGVPHARSSEGKAFGFERTLGTAQAYAGSLNTVDALLRASSEFRGSTSTEDAAVLVLRYTGIAEPVEPVDPDAVREDNENLYRALLLRAKGRR